MMKVLTSISIITIYSPLLMTKKPERYQNVPRDTGNVCSEEEVSVSTGCGSESCSTLSGSGRRHPFKDLSSAADQKTSFISVEAASSLLQPIEGGEFRLKSQRSIWSCDATSAI